MPDPRDFFVIVHNIRSLYNVGSVFRTADAFGISKVYLTGRTGNPKEFNNLKKIAKTALGAEQTVTWEYVKSPKRLVGRLKASHPKIKIIALENNVRSVRSHFLLHKFTPKFPLALVLGEETKSIPGALLQLCDSVVEIPMQGQKESLNVSVAFGIAAYYFAKR
jgi:tRNA G18 (ribose-2'-O)-methylase SpoU